MDPNVEPLLTAVKEKRRRPAHHQSVSDEILNSPLAMFLAGVARAILFTAKRNVILGFVRKRAFVTLGRRTTRSSVVASRNKIESAEKHPPPKSLFSQRSGLLLKNIILGMSVFGVYEYVVDSQLRIVRVNEKGSQGGGETIETVEVPLVTHFCAGACAGVAQTAVLTAWEIASRISPRRAFTNFEVVQNLSLDTRFLFRRTVHHAVGYASLFGCFEGLRRLLLQQFYDYLSSGSEWVPVIFEELERHRLIKTERERHGEITKDVLDVTPVTLTAAFVAGGFAGQVHHVVSHYTCHWKLQAPTIEPKMEGPASAMSSTALKRVFGTNLPAPPTIRSTMGAFGPAALCFVAFQYGGELTARMMEQEGKSRPFPVFCN